MGVEGIRHPRGSEAVLCRRGRRERGRGKERNMKERPKGEGGRCHRRHSDPGTPDATFPGAQAFARPTLWEDVHDEAVSFPALLFTVRL